MAEWQAVVLVRHPRKGKTEKLPVRLPNRDVEVSILEIQGCEPVALTRTSEQRSDSEHSEFPRGNESVEHAKIQISSHLH